MRVLLWTAVLIVALGTALPARATTYYVRTDGGTATQCTGLADAAYSGSGEGVDCAWAHPYWALTGTEPPQWRFSGGDRLLIAPGSYRMGYGAPNTGWCSQEYPWDCDPPALPSGPDAATPTVLAGSGWQNGCANKPELWGTQRALNVLNLDGTSHAVVACLEVTDHSSCVDYHAAAEAECNRDAYPYGDWASYGLYAADSQDVLLQDLDIHGMADSGLYSGRLADWTMRRVRLAGNGWSGWNGDLGAGSSSNSGDMVLKDVVVEWNGCAETWPGQAPANCWGQSAGGYGDGVGMAATGGDWLVEDSTFRYNTSDGLDLLYVGREASDATVTVRRVLAYSNAGNPMKTANTSHIENAVLISDCAFFEGKSFAPNIDGQPALDHCRSLGNALELHPRQGQSLSLINSTLTGEGDCLIIVECAEDSSCDGSETLTFRNLVLYGQQDYYQPWEQSCDMWSDINYTLQADYNVVYDVKRGGYVLGANDLTSDPRVRNAGLDSFDGRLRADSPARDSGQAVGGLVPATDVRGRPRPAGSGVDRGAYEMQPGQVAPGAALLLGE